MLRLGDHRGLRRDPQPRRLRLPDPHAARSRYPGRLRPAQERERKGPRQRPAQGRGRRARDLRLYPQAPVRVLSRAAIHGSRLADDHAPPVSGDSGLRHRLPGHPAACRRDGDHPVRRSGPLHHADAAQGDHPDPRRQHRRGGVAGRGADRPGHTAGRFAEGVDDSDRAGALGRGDHARSAAELPAGRPDPAGPAPTHPGRRDGRGRHVGGRQDRHGAEGRGLQGRRQLRGQ